MRDAETMEWMRTQLDEPQANFSMGELAELSGLELRRLRRYLRRKKVIPERNDGEIYDVAYDSIVRMTPEFWRSIRLRIAKLVGEEE